LEEFYLEVIQQFKNSKLNPISVGGVIWWEF
jgi:hypothetical protein